MEDVKCLNCGRAVHPYHPLTDEGKCPVCLKEIEEIYFKIFDSIAPDEGSTIRGYHLRNFFEAGYRAAKNPSFEPKIQIEYYSNTYPNEDVEFVIAEKEQTEGDSEKTVRPLIGGKFRTVSEDTYRFDGTFEEGKDFLNGLGFIYMGAVEEDAMV